MSTNPELSDNERLAASGGYLPPLKSHPSEYDRAWARLVREVNARRYCGARRNEPMTDDYYWPLEIKYIGDIAQAALRLVVAAERKADNAPRRATRDG
jgi:hypothetical protein